MKRLAWMVVVLVIICPSICGAWSFNDFTDEYKSAVDDVIANDSNANGIPDTADTGGTGAETDPVTGSVTGIVKANGSGTISAAIPMTDYMIPFNIYGTAGWQAEHVYAVGATFSALEEGGSTSYRIVHTGFTSDATYDLTGKETANTYAYYISPAAVSGSEDAFTGWDKDSSDDFGGSFNSLSDLPTTFPPASHGDDAHSETYLKPADIGVTVQAAGSYLTSYLPRHYAGPVADPYNQYAKSIYIPLQISTDEAITITRVEVQCKSDPTTELNWNLMYADDFITLANPMLIRSMDTTAGVLNATTGWTDETVPQGKCVYILFDAQPGQDTPITIFEIEFVITP